MDKQLDLDALGKGILALIGEYGLPMEFVGITLTMSASDFDTTAKNHPDQIMPYILRKTGVSHGCQWYIQVQRRPSVDEFPPGAIIAPPHDV
jgi:hypothetical protein